MAEINEKVEKTEVIAESEAVATKEEATVSVAEYEKVKKTAEEMQNKWYYTVAEYENYRRRTATQKQQSYAEGKSDILVKVLPVKDNLERAILTCADEKTKTGITMVLKSFDKLFAEEKIEEINPIGEEFDANIAEAVMAMPAEEGEESGIVKQVYLKGYRMGTKIIRYAQVVVTQ